MWVSGGQQRDSAIYIHVSILSQFPSCPGCHVTLNRVPVLYSRFLLVIHFKYGSVYMSIPNSEVGSVLWDWTLNVWDLINCLRTELNSRTPSWYWRIGWCGGKNTYTSGHRWASLVPKHANPHTKQETWVRSLGREDPLEEEMATHSSILDWEISWTEEPGGLQSMGSKKNWTQLRN